MVTVLDTVPAVGRPPVARPVCCCCCCCCADAVPVCWCWTGLDTSAAGAAERLLFGVSGCDGTACLADTAVGAVTIESTGLLVAATLSFATLGARGDPDVDEAGGFDDCSCSTDCSGERDGLGRTGGGGGGGGESLVAGGWADTLVGVIGGGRLAGTGLCPYTGGVLIDDEPRDPLSCGTLGGTGRGICCGRSSCCFSRRYSSIQKSFFGCGRGALRNAAIGFGGIFISGRMPIGGGSKLCGRGDLRASELLAVGWAGPGGGGGGGIDRLPPFDGSTRPVNGCLSRRIIAFCTQAGGSAGSCACIRRAELPIVDCGGPP
uniref:Uncharacterized protein n=1 Tax=Anopheles merus TaxID=30066 RepID=A0A182UP02_ANOME